MSTTPCYAEVVYDNGSDVFEGQFTLYAILLSQLAVTTNPTKMRYAEGEAITYSGMVVTATYNDESTANVTNQCVITPAEGKHFNPETDTNVEIVYTEGQDEAETYLTLTHFYVVSISVLRQPTKTSYKYGETIDYSGLLVQAAYSDGTTGLVTNMCAINPPAGTTFDPDTMTDVTIQYAMAGSTEVVETQLTLTPITVTSLTITNPPSTTSYWPGDTISYAGIVVTATYSDGTTENVTSSCIFDPPAGTAFVSGTDSVTISLPDGSETTAEVDLQVTEMELVSIAVTTPPTKTSYIDGEPISYAGIVVTATYSDNSTENVTSQCVFTPTAGTPFDPETHSEAVISFTTHEQTETTDVMLMEKTFMIAVTTQPRKTAYRYHESISYTGMVVTATYSDQTTANVTSLCTITPVAGKAYDAETDETVTISYTEYSTTEETELQLTSVIPTSLTVRTNPSKMSYKTGEEISYTGMNVTANLSDGTHDNIQKRNLVIVPADGKAFNPNTDTNVSISYTEGHETVDAYLMFTPITLTQIAVTTQPTKTTYSAGDPISYTGIVVTATYSDSTTEDITSKVTYSVAEGTPFNAATTSNITITYTNGVETATTNLLLEEEAGDAFTLAITTEPSTTEYAEGTTISLAGMVAVLTAQDGTNSAWNDVADWCISDPAVMPSTDVTAQIKCQPAETPSTYDFNKGWIDSGGVWTYEYPTQTYTDIYAVTSGHKYSLRLGAVVGSRFRAMFTTTDVTQITGGTVSGTQIIYTSNPSAYAKASDFTAPSNGYILVSKDNTGVSGLHSYLFDLDAVDASKTIATTQRFTVAVGFQTMEVLEVTDSYEVDDEITYENIVIKYNWDQSDSTKYTEIEGETALEALEFSLQEGTTVTAAMDGTEITVTGAVEVVPSMAHAADIGVDDYGDFYADYADAYSYIFPCYSGHTYIVCMGADAANYLVVASFSQTISPGTSDVSGGTVYDIYGRGAHQAIKFDCEDTGEVCATSFSAGAEIHLLDCGNISQAVSDTFTISVGNAASYTIDSITVETQAGYDSWYGNAYTIYKSVTIYYHVGTSGQLMAYFTLSTNQETETDKDDYIIPGSGGEFTYKTWHGCYPVGVVKKGTGLYYNYYHWSEASDPHFAEAWEQYGSGRSMPEYAADCSVDCSLRSRKFASLIGE